MTTIPIKYLSSMLSEMYPETSKQWPIFGSDDFLDRSTVVTASEAGACTRRLTYEKKFPELRNEDYVDTWGFGVRGHAVEDWVINQMEESLMDTKTRLVNVGANQRSFVDTTDMVSGTPDGILHDPTTFDMGLEVKSFDPRSNTSKFPKPEHIAQLQINMHLINKLHPDYMLTKGVLMYVNASDFADIYEFEVDLDAGQYAIAKAKSKAVRAAEAPKDANTTMNAQQCKYCAFTRDCGKINGKKKKPAAPKWPASFKTTGEKTMYEEFLALRDKRDVALVKYDALEVRVKADLSRRKEAVWVGDVQIGYGEQAPRKTLSKRLMENAGIDLEPFYETGAPYSRLFVSKAPKKEG